MNDTLTLLLVVAGVALAALAVFVAARAVVENRRQVVVRRLSAPGGSLEASLVEQYEASRRQAPKGAGENLARRMDEAFPRMIERTGLALNADQALGIICLVGVILATVLYLWRGELWMILVGLIVGLAAPLGILLYLQGRWRWRLQQQLPDAIFLLARSLRAGLSLEQALELAGNEGLEPLATEFRRCAEKINLGLAIPMALQSTARRLQLMDFNVLVSVVALHRTTGGNLAVLMDRLAQSTRDRNQYHGYFRSATALGRITAIAIGSAVPVIFVGYAVLEPTYAARFFETAAGLSALGIAFALEVVGAVWLYFLLRVRY